MYCSDASRVYEAMCDALPWRERGQPLQITFVAQPVYPPGAPQRPQVRDPLDLLPARLLLLR